MPVMTERRQPKDLFSKQRLWKHDPSLEEVILAPFSSGVGGDFFWPNMGAGGADVAAPLWALPRWTCWARCRWSSPGSGSGLLGSSCKVSRRPLHPRRLKAVGIFPPSASRAFGMPSLLAGHSSVFSSLPPSDPFISTVSLREGNRNTPPGCTETKSSEQEWESELSVGVGGGLPGLRRAWAHLNLWPQHGSDRCGCALVFLFLSWGLQQLLLLLGGSSLNGVSWLTSVL